VPIDANHIDMGKFSTYDENYWMVSDYSEPCMA
jgi:hypothetical protein